MAKKKAETPKPKPKPKNTKPKNTKITKNKTKIKNKNKVKVVVTKTPKKTVLSDSYCCSDSDNDSETLFNNFVDSCTKQQLVSLISDIASSSKSFYSYLLSSLDKHLSHRKLFVHGFPYDVDKQTLEKAFEEYGEIEDCNVILDRISGKSKGYGFVLFASRKGAIKALEEPKKMIGNKIASCQLSSVGGIGSASNATQPKDATLRKIYVSNVPTDTNPERLKTFFEKFGEIETGPMGFDSLTGKCRGFALFLYKTVESAKKALQEPYKLFEGHKLLCQQATERKHKEIVGGAATITMAVQPMQAPVLATMAAAQNMAMMSQQYQYPTLNPLYNNLLSNPMMATQGYAGLGQMGGYGTTMVGQAGNFGGNLNSSAMSTYGASGSGQVGLQHAYLGSSSTTPGAAGGSCTGLASPLFKR